VLLVKRFMCNPWGLGDLLTQDQTGQVNHLSPAPDHGG